MGRCIRGGIGGWLRDAALLALACLLLLPALAVHSAQAGGFHVHTARTVLIDEVYRLDAEVRHELTATALEALHNGVPLTFEIEIEVYRLRWLVWDQKIADLRQRYRLQYHALSEQYLLTNLNSRSQQSYHSRQAAMNAIGTIADFPMLDRRLLRVGERYGARLRTRLDIEALPTPLRLLAYVSADWRLRSEWYGWEL
jgi:hypothetical protein